jgi:hypothetical protein
LMVRPSFRPHDRLISPAPRRAGVPTAGGVPLRSTLRPSRVVAGNAVRGQSFSCQERTRRAWPRRRFLGPPIRRTRSRLQLSAVRAELLPGEPAFPPLEAFRFGQRFVHLELLLVMLSVRYRDLAARNALGALGLGGGFWGRRFGGLDLDFSFSQVQETRAISNRDSV